MSKSALAAAACSWVLVGAFAVPVIAQEAPPPNQAPKNVVRDAKLFIEDSEFGMAFAAAILKKKVPVVVVKDKEKAEFFAETTSTQTKEGTGERITKVIVLGTFAGSGRRFEGTVTVMNKDGAVVFAHNTKKENFQSAAENVANELKKHIERNEKKK